MKTGKMKTSKMKTSINLKTRKMKNKYLKLVMMAAVMLSASIGFAQTTSGDITVGANAGLGTSGTSVKVIDNKGTVKYLQSNNGITTFTNDTPSGGVVTTWQLGGTLTSETTITTDGTNTLAIAGLEAEVGNAAIAGGAAGYALVVQDGAGKLKKLYAADILAGAAITGIRDKFDILTTVNAAFNLTVPGLPIITDGTAGGVANDFKLSVYRNGVKLRFETDFTATAVNTLNILWDAANLPIYIGDVIEIQYLN
jgi:hypothetical protein